MFANKVYGSKTLIEQLVFIYFNFHFSGDFVGRVTPVPIPNTEVKPTRADDTAWEAAWESRKSPDLISKGARSVHLDGLFYLMMSRL